jgi:ABC-type uncharacterized transport system substrate-binding protein
MRAKVDLIFAEQEAAARAAKDATDRVPVVFSAVGDPVATGMVKAMAQQAARLVAKILRGERPQDLPVEGANRIDLVVSLKTAKQLRLTIPESVLARADRVIRE